MSISYNHPRRFMSAGVSRRGCGGRNKRSSVVKVVGLWRQRCITVSGGSACPGQPSLEETSSSPRSSYQTPGRTGAVWPKLKTELTSLHSTFSGLNFSDWTRFDFFNPHRCLCPRVIYLLIYLLGTLHGSTLVSTWALVHRLFRLFRSAYQHYQSCFPLALSPHLSSLSILPIDFLSSFSLINPVS
ncbi:hypothetical protein B0J11DRAFT_115634 [Dendryphion nanum]|uniref:Uncharacterized protein n=1 Tax=Dendryphion nanum TaxID=256645 RepID=A0A9P9IE09_9PLEO|nr:hypothetical protein B0J11DRAFT_115634 [Dendryphion nanum]